MKLRLIENICKRTVSLVLLTGICLLYSKGIIPVYLLVLFLLSGTLISLLFRTFTLIVKIIIALTVMGMLVSVSYTHLRAHETCADLVCRLLLEKT